MTFLPIVARELRVAARRRTTYLGRVGAAIVPIAIAGFWLPVFAAQFSLSQGKELFTVLTTVTFVYCLLAGMFQTSDSVSAEKREGTIGLLFLTDLKGYDVILGKLVSRSLSALYGLIAIVPVLALALLLGGVTLAEITRMALVFANTLFFSMAAGVFASTFSRHDRRAMFATGCVILLACFAPLGLAGLIAWWHWARTGNPPGAESDLAWALVISPLYPFHLLRSNFFGQTMASLFHQSLLSLHVLSWLLLGAASLVIPRVCRERPPGRLGMRWVDWRNRWSYGSPARRRAFRQRLLDRNAFFWLAARDRIKAHYVWFFIGALAAIWAWSGWLMGSFIFDWDVSFWLLYLFFVFLKVWLASEVCSRLVEDRASGAFELLLSSPLELRELAQGQSLALRRQFGRPVLAGAILALLLLWSGLQASHSGMGTMEIKMLFGALILMLVADMLTLQWVGMWQAITSNQVNRAVLAACLRVLILPSLLFAVLHAMMLLYEQSTASSAESDGAWGRGALLWLAIGLGADLFFGLRARWLFLRHFRQVATERFSGVSLGLQPFVEFLGGAQQRLTRGWRLPGKFATLLRYWKLWALAVPVLIMAAVWVYFSWSRHSFQREVDARLASLSASGIPTTPAGLRAWFPPILDSANAAAVLQSAQPLFVPPRNMGKQLPRGAFEWPKGNAPLPPEGQAALADLVRINERALAQVEAAASLTNSQCPVDWRFASGQVAIWQAFTPFGSAIEVLPLFALHSLETGSLTQAVHTVHTLLALARLLDQEPYQAAHFQRAASLRAAVRVLERILNTHPLGPAEAQTLTEQLRLAERATGPSLARSLTGERCFEIDEVLYPNRPNNLAWRPALTGIPKFIQDVRERIAEWSGLRQEALVDYLDSIEDAIRRAPSLELTASDESASTPATLEGRAASTRTARLAMFRHGHNQRIRQDLALVASLRAAQTALAVERFRAIHPRKAPDSLAELVPEFLPESPRDPFAPAPLRYLPLPDGYSIYSVGPDHQDAGGTPGSPPVRLSGRSDDIGLRVERSN